MECLYKKNSATQVRQAVYFLLLPDFSFRKTGILVLMAAVLLLALSPQAQGFDRAGLRSLSTAELLQQVRIHQCSMQEMDALLPELERRFPAFDDRVEALAKLYLGAPYVVDPLTHEMTDWLPYQKTNCTMLVLYVAALARSHSLAGAREHMRLLHYRGGAVGFRSRYHFTEDRITDPDNRYFAEATVPYARDKKSLRRVTLELNRKKNGELLLGNRLGSWTKKITLAYVPRAGFLPELLVPLPHVTGIAFVKKDNWDKGLIVGHEGLLIAGDLYHASPQKGVVVVKDYLAAAFPQSGWEGFILFNLMPPGKKGESPQPAQR